MFLDASIWLKIVTLCAISGALTQSTTTATFASKYQLDTTSVSTSPSQEQLQQRIYGLLDKLSCGRKLNASAKFALLLAEFLIKREPNELCTFDRCALC